MIRFGNSAPERELYPLRPLPGTEGKATFAVSAAVLDLLGLIPEQASRLDLAHVLHLIHEEGA
ncbi:MULTISPECIES: hypothetical protein [unclassified Streptomyces]|uniref:hypothetical protein n=1 Tax=unclassified Streptomyces TaxID=2593676 RepID=UPI002DD90F0A|nr:hypothetical protein [Streptomyces sp. NBC_01766]WSC22800.1 hypothetical protein OIE60_25760 [Streptomyces sp. NBC_01766]WSV56712.1 hypothetical protein OG282_25180 [Streptomyces sp. NBC_01014]